MIATQESKTGTLPARALNTKDLKEAAYGQGAAILYAVGQPVEFLDKGRYHPCPMCGKDTFKFRDTNEGGAVCQNNSCKFEGLGDWFDFVQWIRSVDFAAAKQIVADAIGFTSSRPGKGTTRPAAQPTSRPATKSQSDKAVESGFQKTLEPDPRGDCLFPFFRKPPISVMGIQRAGAFIAHALAHPKVPKMHVLAVPAYDPESLEQVDWVLYHRDGNTELPVGKGETAKTKMHLGKTGVLLSQYGLGLLRAGRPVPGLRLLKVEGASDFLAMLSRLDEQAENLLIFSNTDGAKSIKTTGLPFVRKFIQAIGKPSTIHCVGDCDTAGQEGLFGGKTPKGRHTTGWAQILAGLAEDGCFVHELPYPIEPKKGKDLRDWLNEGNDAAKVFSLPARKVAAVDMELQEEKGISNYRLDIVIDEDGKERRTKVAYPQKLLVEKILDRFDGWPKRYSGQLFICRGDEVEILRKPNHLFSWMREQSEITWGIGESMVNRDELQASLLRHAESFDDIQHYPHFPKVAGVYYSCPDCQPGEGKYLDRLLDFFSPATPIDRELILAAIVTTLWGGLAGQRPAFLIEAEARAGQGSGKSTAAQLISRITGGFVDLPTKKIDIDDIKKRFLNATAASQRVALLDNVKTSNFSDAGVESLMTSPTINGHKLFVGNSSRPNFYTWFITMNGPKLSRDFAQRCVSILISRPQHSGDWLVNVASFIESHRLDIFADVAGFFHRPQQKLSTHSRWGVWEQDIVSRLDSPNAIVKIIRQREAANDVDHKTAVDIEEYIEKQLERYGYAQPMNIHIPTKLMFTWTTNAMEENEGLKKTTAFLDRLENCGSFRRLRKNPSHSQGRGWIFDSVGDEKIDVSYDLEERMVIRNGPHE